MDNMEYVQEEEGGWFGANWYLIILNMIIGAVVFFVIWFCSKQGEEEEKEEENDVCTANESPKKENKAEPIVEVKTSVNVDWKPQVTTDAPVVEKVTTCTKTEIKTTETIVEKVLVEEIGQKEVPAATVFVEEEKPLLDIDVVVKEPAKPEPKKEIIEEEDVVSVEDVSDLHNESEDHLHFSDHEEEKPEVGIEQESPDSSSSDLNGEGFVVVKQVETSDSTVTTTVKSEEEETKTTIPEFTKYEIDVKTGDKSGAGTDANVFVIIYGENGYTAKIALENSSSHKHKFEKNHIDSFCEEAVNVGQLSKIRIGHDNKGGFAGWYLDSVIVNVPALSCQWTFEAKRWLDKHEDDKQIEIDLFPTLIEEIHEEISYTEETVPAAEATSEAIVEHVTTTTSEEVLSLSGEVLSSTSKTETEIYKKNVDDVEDVDATTDCTVETIVTTHTDVDAPSIDEDECKGKDD